MIDPYLLVKFMHVLGAIVVLGTGVGIAFFMVMAHRSRDPTIVAHSAGVVVIADFVFTATAVIAQPITGLFLASMTGQSLWTIWIAGSIGLYLLTGCFWLPVVWLQMRMRDLARLAVRDGMPLPDLYHRYYRRWFACGFPAFGAVLAIIWLMIAKPV